MRPAFLVCCWIVLATPVSAAELAHLSSPAPVDVLATGFEIDVPATVQIEATGVVVPASGESRGRRRNADGGALLTHAWLLDARSRAVIWAMDEQNADPGPQEGLRVESASVDLPAGRYELYLCSTGLPGDGSQTDAEALFAGAGIRTAADLSAAQFRHLDPDPVGDNAVVSLTGVGDNELRRVGFRVGREVEVRVISFLEFPRGNSGPTDAGWIEGPQTGERAWDGTRRHGSHAGGDLRNRVIDRRLTLVPGDYTLFYATDGSHSADGFTAAPPRDPLGWGARILVGNPADRDAIELRELRSPGKVLVDFSGLGDDEFHEQTFRVRQPGPVRLIALGEQLSRSRRWADHTWIMDAARDELVWTMDGRNTRFAGGARKNRVFDGEVNLPVGDYVLFCSTDDSHSFGDFNASGPFDPSAWGVRLFARPGLEIVDRADADARAGVLASIREVGSDERIAEGFHLDRETSVEISASGEGRDGEMFDYGWIRDVNDGRVVWKMKYRDTVGAGGAEKNRRVRESITLPAGDYEILYVTDDSHAFGDWNTRLPEDPTAWGIRVRRVD